MGAIVTTPGASIAASVSAVAGDGTLPWEPGRGGAPQVFLQDRILAITGTMTVRVMLLCDLANLTLVSGDASVYADLSGFGDNATQGTAGARPTFNATGLGGGPSLDADGGDWMRTPNIGIGGAADLALIKIFEIAIPSAGGQWGGYGNIDAGENGLALLDNGGSSRVNAKGRDGALGNQSRAATGTGDDPHVWTATWDSSLLDGEDVKIRKDGAVADDNRNESGNLVAPDDNLPLTLFARGGTPASFVTGAAAAHVLLSGVLDLTQVAAIEAELVAALAAGDYRT